MKESKIAQLIIPNMYSEARAVTYIKTFFSLVAKDNLHTSSFNAFSFSY